jgi:hypothetical protein
LAAQQAIHADAFKALNNLGEWHNYVAKVTPPEMATEWLP